MFRLYASDHRPGAFGDEVMCDFGSIEIANQQAMDLNCGIWEIRELGTINFVAYEWDGLAEPYIIDGNLR